MKLAARGIGGAPEVEAVLPESLQKELSMCFPCGGVLDRRGGVGGCGYWSVAPRAAQYDPRYERQSGTTASVKSWEKQESNSAQALFAAPLFFKQDFQLGDRVKIPGSARGAARREHPACAIAASARGCPAGFIELPAWNDSCETVQTSRAVIESRVLECGRVWT